jgi:hypothetical protein
LRLEGSERVGDTRSGGHVRRRTSIQEEPVGGGGLCQRHAGADNNGEYWSHAR